ncbi:MAG TPA: arginase family protein [Candidatus Nanoarchaeia archaeon]|nr:arginase family protein [Candidatus Nanoarchaeia archaeon]
MTIVVNVPIENSLDSLGCRKAGQKIISEFPEKYFSENNKEIEKESISFKEISLDGIDVNSVHDLLDKEIFNIFHLNNFKEKLIFLGGDHSLTYYSALSFFRQCNEVNEKPFLIIFDAHADCKKEFNGNFSNISWTRGIIKEGFPSENIIFVGLRNLTKEENEFLSDNNIRCYMMKDLTEFQEICDIIMELANKSKIYISIDIDVVDAAFVPGTARPESGGMTSRQLVYFLHRLNILKGVSALDIVEINPDKDFKDVTLNLGIKILGEII